MRGNLLYCHHTIGLSSGADQTAYDERGAREFAPCRSSYASPARGADILPPVPAMPAARTSTRHASHTPSDFPVSKFLSRPVSRDQKGHVEKRQGIQRILNQGRQFSNGTHVFLYPNGDAHEPASYTVLNFPVDDIDATVDALVEKGVEFERYPETEYLKQDAK